MQRLLLLTFVILLACSSDQLDMTGSYMMTSRSVAGGGALDTMIYDSQMKIYTGGHVIFAQFGPDSTATWAVRKVLPIDGGVRESNVYGAMGVTELPGPHIYTLEVETTADGFKQVITDLEYRGQMMGLTEEYERVDSGMPTPYDGAWELTDAFIVNGADTTHLDITQYKFYHSGNFVFGHSLRDSLKNSAAGFGYGTFSMSNDSTLTENVSASSYSQIVGKSFNIKVKLDGQDKLFQIVDELEGAKSVETYKRL
jgi:hypothetical protein